MGRKSRAKKVRREAKQAKEDRSVTGQARGCIICRQSLGGFSSREHIVPEALGNREDLVIESGVICDRCNNGVLSRLDQALVEFKPMGFIRTHFGFESKAGKMPSVRFSNGVASREDSGTVVYELQDKPFKYMEESRNGNSFSLNLDMGYIGGPIAQKVSRALTKIAYECAWLDHGEAILAESYDLVRSVITGGDFHSSLLIATEVPKLHHEIRYSLCEDVEGNQGIAIAANFCGLALATNSLESSEITKPDEGILVDF